MLSIILVCAHLSCPAYAIDGEGCVIKSRVEHYGSVEEAKNNFISSDEKGDTCVVLQGEEELKWKVKKSIDEGLLLSPDGSMKLINQK